MYCLWIIQRFLSSHMDTMSSHNFRHFFHQRLFCWLKNYFYFIVIIMTQKFYDALIIYATFLCISELVPWYVSLSNIRHIALSRFCVPGVLVSMSAGPTPVVSAQGGGVSMTLKQQTVSDATGITSGATSATGTNDPVVEVANVTSTVRPENTTNGSSAHSASTLANTKEKTPMCLVNELARYNKVLT